MSDWKIATNSLIIKTTLDKLLPEGGVCHVLDSLENIDYHFAALCLSDVSPEQLSQLSDYSGLILTDVTAKIADLTFTLQDSEALWSQRLQMIEKVAIQRQLLFQQQQLNQEMTEIGIALSSEKELSRLLTMILEEGRKLSSCEAASLYLVDRRDKLHPFLTFMLFQNEKLDVPFEEKRYPLNHQSMAGHSAISGEILNIPDVYNIPDSEPYVFDDSFDKTYNYRTREAITIPMRNHKDEIIGILQFLNRKKPQDQEKLFDQDTCDLLTALASQSAVAIDNSLLLENIRDLFEGFVSAAVTAIEARDPITSGHSFRVAVYTCNLAECLPQHYELSTHALTVEAMRELRYAALLHDFGKVGVREHILQKAKKLNYLELDLIQWRLKWYREKLKADFYQTALNQQSRSDINFSHWFDEQMALYEQRCKQIEQYLEIIKEANEPSVLHQDNFEKLQAIRNMQIESADESGSLLSESEFLSLSVTKGSLTPDERNEIQSHVSHTFDFLKQIPWTSDLQNIPFIASAHHEKLDGSGYPFGLKADEIPVQTRIMTISDIYDALTAADRPYKAALPSEKALDILTMEAEGGKLDPRLVNLFIEAKAYRQTG